MGTAGPEFDRRLAVVLSSGFQAAAGTISKGAMAREFLVSGPPHRFRSGQGVGAEQRALAKRIA